VLRRTERVVLVNRAKFDRSGASKVSLLTQYVDPGGPVVLVYVVKSGQSPRRPACVVIGHLALASGSTGRAGRPSSRRGVSQCVVVNTLQRDNRLQDLQQVMASPTTHEMDKGLAEGVARIGRRNAARQDSSVSCWSPFQNI
jgi:hypothetical protein